MNNIVVIKTPHYMRYCIDLTDSGEELISQAFSLARPFYQSGDIYKFKGGWNNFLGIHQTFQNFQTFVRNRYHSYVGLNRTKRKIGRLCLIIGQCIKQSRFSHVGQANNSTFESHDETDQFKNGCKYSKWISR